MFYISFPLYFFSRPNYNAWQVRKNSPQAFCSWYLISSETALVLLARVLPRPLNPPGPTFADRTGDLDPGLLTGSS